MIIAKFEITYRYNIKFNVPIYYIIYVIRHGFYFIETICLYFFPIRLKVFFFNA